MTIRIAPREILSVLVIVAVSAAVGGILPRAMPTLAAAENWLRDFRFGALTPPRPQNPDVVVIAITEDTLATLPYRSPVDRGFLANLLGVLEAAKPRAIGVDILFDQPTEPAKDDALGKRLRGLSVPVVVATAAKADGLTKRQETYLGRFTEGLNLGLVNLLKDRTDGTVRWIFGGEGAGPKRKPSLTGVLAGFLGLDVPDRDVALVYTAGPGDGTPAFRVFAAHTAAFLPKQWFAGKVILIGADLPLIDRHRTPFVAALGARQGNLPGIFVFAHAMVQLLEGRTSPDLGPIGEIALVLLLAGAGMLFAVIDRPLPVKGALNLGGLVLLWAGGFALYRYGGVMIPLIAPTLSFTMSASGGVAYLGRRDRKQKKFIREAFSRYVSPVIVDKLIADPGQLNVGGERRELTYLFTDLANFTSLTERTEPSVLVPLLNEYLNSMCKILFEHGATIDKIVGDAVVGFFNAPVDQADHRARAVAAALDLDAFANDFIARQAANGLEVGITRIGVHSGIAVIGNFGGEMFFDYTAHGDMVNTAARLESVNKHLGTRVCISGATREGCPEVAFRPVGALVLKGKTQGIEVFEPLRDGQEVTPATALYNEAFEMMRRHDSAAADKFREVLKIDKDDGLARFHLGRLEKGETGVTIVMEEK